jgi:uncharacterized membrane protein
VDLTALFVLARIVANPVSNVFQKQLARRGMHPLAVIGATHALLAVATLPLLAGPVSLAQSAGFWANITACALLAVASNVLLVYALRAADLSLLGALNAWKAVIGLMLAVFLVGELPNLPGLAGVLLIVAGSYFLVEPVEGRRRGNALGRFFGDPGVRLRLAALLLSAAEAVFLKRAILQSSPLSTFVFWSLLGLPVALAAGALLLRQQAGRQVALLWRDARTCLALACATGGMQLATLLTLGQLQVGYSLALFQLSALLSLFLGHRYFQEGRMRQRLLGTLVMIAGALLISLFGKGMTS